jgi:hypothetical protein
MDRFNTTFFPSAGRKPLICEKSHSGEEGETQMKLLVDFKYKKLIKIQELPVGTVDLYNINILSHIYSSFICCQLFKSIVSGL